MENETPVEEAIVAEIETVQDEPVVTSPESVEEVTGDEVATSDQEAVADSEPEAPTHGTSLLGEASSEGGEKSSEEPEAGGLDSEKEETKELEVIQPIEPIVYEEFKIPEGIKVDNEQIEEFTKTIGEYRLPQEAAQKLMDMHARNVEDIAKQVSENQWKVFHDQQNEWKKEVMSDPILGGSGHKTAMQKIADVRDHFVPEERRQAFKDAVAMTGAGNNIEILRVFHDMHKYISEGKILDVPIGVPSDIGAKPKTRAEMMYGNTHKSS